MANVHPTAIIDPDAQLAPDVEIGPYCVVGPGVSIGAGTRLSSHVVVRRDTVIGANNRIFQFASIGEDPQDKKYAGERTLLKIGNGNTIREFVTINRGTAQDRGETVIGDDNWIMAYVHVAHDCLVGSHTIFANSTNLAGHVEIGDWVILGGVTGVHQFCKVGAHAMTGVGTVLLHDLPPYVMCSGNTASAHGLNSEGLRRRGFDAAAIGALRNAYKTLYKSGLTLEQAKTELDALADPSVPGGEQVQVLRAFLDRVTRGIVR